jgi:hypothetical protein
MNKIKKIGLFIGIALLFFTSFSFFSSAQEETNGDLTLRGRGILVATVNTSDVAIKEQNGNQMKIGFSLFNRENAQSDIVYAVDLTTTEKEQNLIDQKIYFDQKVSLGKGETVSREVEYNAPTGISGKYKVFINVENNDGIILSRSLAGEVILSASSQALLIDTSSCRIKNEKNGEEKNASDSISGSADDGYIGKCLVKNDSTESISTVLKLEVRRKSAFGEILYENSQNFNFSPKSEKNVSFTLPKLKNNQATYLELSFRDEKGETVSNIFSSLIRNEKTQLSLINVRLDKDGYAIGDLAKIFINIRQVPGDAGFYLLEYNFSDLNDVSCIDPEKISKSLSGAEVGNTIEISQAISKNCLNPKLNVLIKDKSGSVVDSQNYSFETKSDAAATLIEQQEKNKKTARTSRNIVLAAMALILLAVFGRNIFESIKYRNFKMPFFFVVVAGGLIFFGNATMAETYVNWDGKYGLEVTIEFENAKNNPPGVSNSGSLAYHTDEHIKYKVTVKNNQGGGQSYYAYFRGNVEWAHPNWDTIINQNVSDGSTISTENNPPVSSMPVSNSFIGGTLWINSSVCSGEDLNPCVNLSNKSFQNGICGKNNGGVYNKSYFYPPTYNAYDYCHTADLYGPGNPPGDKTWCNYGCFLGAGDDPHINNATGKIEWICRHWGDGVSLGYDSTCSESILINGQCGDFQGKPICKTNNLSSGGYGCKSTGWENIIGSVFLTNIQGTGPFTWDCQGTGGAALVHCASGAPAPAACGTAAGVQSNNVPPKSGNTLCATGIGTTPVLSADGKNWNWTCHIIGQPVEYGCDAQCSAPKYIDGVCLTKTSDPTGMRSMGATDPVTGLFIGQYTSLDGDELTSVKNKGCKTGQIANRQGNANNNYYTWRCNRIPLGSSGTDESGCGGYKEPKLALSANPSSGLIVKNGTATLSWTSQYVGDLTATCPSNNCQFSAWSNSSPITNLSANTSPYKFDSSKILTFTSLTSAPEKYKLEGTNKAGLVTSDEVSISVVEPTCGSASSNSQSVCSKPASNLCVASSSTAVQDQGDEYTWDCQIEGTTISSCSVKKYCSSDAVWKEVNLY